MTVTFNNSAMDAFSRVSQENLNLAVNVNKETGNLSTTKSGIRAIFRSKASKTANNEARTALLKSLGNAFGLSGMNEQNGRVTFSGEFMNKLGKLIGPAFKAKDFGIPANGGAVSSGKPLTARRVSEIMNRVRVFSGANVDFDANLYKDKLENARSELGLKKFDGIKDPKILKNEMSKLSHEQTVIKDQFDLYSKAFDFFQNFDKYIRVNEEFKFHLELAEFDPKETDKLSQIKNKYEILNTETGEYEPVTNSNDLSQYICKKTGGLLHLENCSFDFNTTTSLKPFNNMKQYIVNHLMMLSRTAIDNYYNASVNGKMNNYLAHLQKPGACIENQIEKFMKFEKENFPRNDDVAVANQPSEADLNRIAKTGKDVSLHECIYAELECLFSDPKYQEYENWEDFAPVIKEHLLNTPHPVTEVVEKDGKAVLDSNNNPLVKTVMDGDKPLVRPLTAEDIDRNGKLIFDASFAV